MTGAQVDIQVVRVDQDADVVVVVARLAGDVDMADTPAVAGQVLAGVPNTAAGLVVDLTAVRYLDSAGIQMLFELARKLEAGRQGMAVVLGAESPLRTLLEMTAMHEAIAICSSEREAVTAARRGAIRRY